MNGALWKTDAIAGGAATVFFLLGVFVLGLTVPVSLGLSLVAYLGLRLALPKPDPAVAESAALDALIARCQEKVVEIQQAAGWAEFTGKPQVEQQLLRIHRAARRVLDAIEQDPNKREAAEPYLTEYLTPITDVLGQYVRLSGRELSLAAAELAELETRTLPLIERRLTKLHEQIHSADVMALELNTKMLEYTLAPIELDARTPLDELAPEEGAAPTPPPADRESRSTQRRRVRGEAEG